MPDTLVATYLNDHLAAANAGEQLFRRAAENQTDAPYATELDDLLAAVREDRMRLRALLLRLQVSENRPKQLMAQALEYAGRLKPNRFVVRRSPLSDLLEVEAMRVGVAAKREGWRALLASEVAADPLVKDELEDLLRRADEQADVLDRLHQQAAEHALNGPV